MLELIIGTAKSGKTTELLNRICGLSFDKDVSGAILVVPEQASFNNERTISEKLGEKAGKVQVVSFSRLAEQALSRLGGFDKPIAAPAAEKLFMSMAISEAAQASPIYGERYRSNGFIEQALQMINELRNAGISPEKLEEAADALEKGPLSEKVKELSVIYGAFEAILGRSYLSMSDMIKLAAKKLDESGEFEDKEIFIDDFGGFTAPELEMISVMLRRAKKVTVTLCCDDIPTFKPAFGLTNDTARILKKLAADADVETEKFVIERAGFKGSLAQMEKSQQNDDIPEEQEGDGSVEAMLCQSVYDELEQVAAKIVSLVQEKGVRYRDIAVIMNDASRYKFALPGVFARFNIPFFWDVRRDARTQLLTGGLLEAVKAAAGVFGSDYLAVARSPLMGLKQSEINELENYCYVWSLKNSDWKKPFTGNPDGMTGAVSDSAVEKLKALEESRRKVAEPIAALAKALKSGKGLTIAQGIWEFLQKTESTRSISRFAADMNENERKSFLEEQSLLWQQLVALLNMFAAASDEFSFSAQRVCELLELAFGEFEVATIPRTLDEVAVGTADRIRCDNVNTVFLMGVVDGEFPSNKVPGGILSEPERKALSETLKSPQLGGFGLFTEGERSFDNESMICYRAVTSPAERLIVSCPKTDADGTFTPPSDIFRRAAALSKKQGETPFDKIWTAECLQKALAENAAEQSEIRDTLSALGCEIFGEEKTNSLLNCEKAVHSLSGHDISRRLYGEKLHISPSRLEQYFKCPFSYFMQKGLHVYKLQKAELSPAQTGTLIHLVLETLVSSDKRGEKPFWEMENAQLRDTIMRLTADYMAECYGGAEAVPARVKSNMEHICEGLLRVVRHLGEELKQSEFKPAAFEMKIGQGGIKPILLKTSEGEEISVEGVVDRVDIAEIKGKHYLRVVDYKSGTKKFELANILRGLDLQMLIYLFSIKENGTGEFENLLPAGVLYLPAMSNYVSVERAKAESDDESSDEELRMKGILLDDDVVLRGMEKELRARFIPYGGSLRSKPVYSQKEFETIGKTVKSQIKGMAERLFGGEIAAAPRIFDSKSPCDWCDYKNVCGFESCDNAVFVPKANVKDIFGEEESKDGEKLDD